MKRIAALVPNILGTSPGQRVRIESWAQQLPRYGWSVQFYPFEDERLHKVLYRPGHTGLKTARILSCMLRQFRGAFRRNHCDLLFIYREAALIGPAIIERLAARTGIPIVYDVDDPIFLPYCSPMNGWFSLLKCSRKTHTLFRISKQVTAINRQIGSYAAAFNPCVSIVPNCIDAEQYRPRKPSDPRDPPRLVWMGSHSTMANLQAIVEPVREVQSKVNAPLRVIGVGQVDLPGVEVEYRQWSAATEVSDLQDCAIGLVPLPEHPWHHWKFFLKTVQYMAAGLPVVAQNMGSNAEVIEDGVTGFLVKTEEEWRERLLTLVQNRALRQEMGAAARQTVIERYSIQDQMPRIAAIFEEVSTAHR